VGRVELLPPGKQQLLGRYQLIGAIASGGMASVFLARLAGVGGFQRLVAIKRLHPHLANEREFVEMFLDEARLAASIHHRNVVPILEIGTSDAGYYLVMEYIEGVTLARLMTQAAVLKEPVPTSVLLRVVIDTLSGLHAAHELTGGDGVKLGVVHRDCSPQNILVGLDGCTRITDFGIARASSRLHNTREGAMKGKLAYMAPEQTQGEEFDLRADIFSVSTVLWEVLAERRLFKGQTEAQTLRHLLHDPIPRLADIEPGVHEALDTICHKGLSRDPQGRFDSAAEMADALEQAARQAGILPEPVATERAVESLMKERYGSEATEMADALREWLSATPTNYEAGPTTNRGLGPHMIDSAPGTQRGIGRADEPTMAVASERQLLGSDVGSDAPPSMPTGDVGRASEQTNIYDPPSTTGMTGATTVATFQPATMRSEAVPERQGNSTVKWVLAAVVVAGLAAVAVVAVRGPATATPARSGPATPTGTAGLTAGTEDTATAQLESDDIEPGTAEPGTTEPGATDSGATEPVATNVPTKPVPLVRPTPRPLPKPASTSEPKPKPKPKPEPADPPPPNPDDIDDLSNPYR
jgi:eukaryotic-like serine/threonine-protein kinase